MHIKKYGANPLDIAYKEIGSNYAQEWALPYITLAAFAYNIPNVSVVFLVLSWLTAPMVSSFSCCSFCNVQKPCTFVVLSSCVIFWSNHLPCRLWHLVFQISQVQIKCYSLHWNFCIMMYDILLTHVWLMLSCKCQYYVILMIPWVIQKKLWMVLFFWFCMDSCTFLYIVLLPVSPFW